MPNITRIDDYQHRDVVAALRDLLHRAERKRMRAFAFVFKDGPLTHHIGFTGEYWDDPAQVLSCISRMEYKANQLVSARDGDPETSSMPL